MKASELMLGDWVCSEGDPTPRQIDWIRTGEVGLFWNKVVTSPYLVPIPLTPEILEKNGFKKIQDQLGCDFYSIADDYFDLTVDEITDSIWRVEYDNLEAQFPTCLNLVAHVHELQHVLRLFGIEKEIKL